MTKFKSTIAGIETTVEAVPAGMDPTEFLKQQMDDCPLCRELRARGEEPSFHIGADLESRISRPTKPFPQRPRWRTMKRRAR
jgi:hypothetical protein